MDKVALSSERLTELRQLIRAKVSSDVVQDKIRQCVSDVEKEGAKEETLLRILEERGLVDEVVEGLGLGDKGKDIRATMTKGETSNGNPSRNPYFKEC